jgi:hypothetical protein
MSHSFCIITGGKRPELLRTVIASIRAQQIPVYEIIVAGIHRFEPGLTYLEAESAANGGRLSEMRNRAVAWARYENVVILDDDIILAPDWYRSFLRFESPFDILTSQVRVPDGSRYVDHATVGGPRGNRILAEDETDDFIYMTGGGGWVMKDYVARAVSWDEDRLYYQEEDVAFSRSCQARGFRIAHQHRMLVFHADPSYTCIGRVVARRQQGHSQQWLLSEFPGLSFFRIIKALRRLRKEGRFAEAADYLRLGSLQGPQRWFFRLLWKRVEGSLGGSLPGAAWYPDGDPAYLSALQEYSAGAP